MSATETAIASKRLLGVRLGSGLALFRAESWLLALVGAILLGAVINALRKHQAVEWVAFSPALLASLGMVSLGIYIRATRPMPRVALGAIGFGLFTSFSGSVAIFIYTLFPLAHPLIDPALIGVDAAMGFSWVWFVELIATVPAFGIALHYIYLSILPQVVFVIILLSFQNRPVDLHRFLAVGFVALIATVAFWWLYPSVGPTALVMVPDDVQSRIMLLADAAYGEEMRRLVYQGIDLITPLRITGVVALPSFHMVMACMVVWFTRGTWAFIPLVGVNLLMLPATIVHGGHHLIDLAGGLVTFSAILWLVTRLIPQPKAV